MIYKNKKTMMIMLLPALVAFFYFTCWFGEIEYRVFGMIGGVWSSVLYVFAVFEYYEIDECKITHVYRLGFKKDEVYWKDVSRVYDISDSIFKAIKMDYGSFADSSMVINSGIKGYEELIRIMLDKTRDNPGIAVDIKLKEFLNE